jgi:hypothetical protein
VNNIKMDVKSCKICECERRGQWRALVKTVMHLRGPIKGKEFLDQLSDC